MVINPHGVMADAEMTIRSAPVNVAPPATMPQAQAPNHYPPLAAVEGDSR